jgi:putative Holliday junction resolvase
VTAISVPPTGPVMSLDVGNRRIGVAICDGLRIGARGLATIHRTSLNADITAIATLLSEHGAVGVVVGDPRLPSGDAGEQAQKVQRFVASLRAVIRVPIVLWDESFTTVAALERLPWRGKRGAKAGLDAEAAAVILEEWMRAQAETPSGAPGGPSGEVTS